MAENSKIEELLYECLLELSYVQSVENCDSGLCKSSNQERLIAEGMELLGVKDLSGETLKDSERIIA